MDHWSSHVAAKYRLNMLLVLEELSRLRSLQDNFALVGGLSLLMRGKLHHQVMWDIDLLFKDKFSIFKFIALPKSSMFDVISMDDQFCDSETIVSFHTAWGFQARWINVDYISRANWYYFHRTSIEREGDFEETIEQEGRQIKIKLPVAHPWDMFIEKVLSPRLENDLRYFNDFSYDLRHVFILLEQEQKKSQFWIYIRRKSEEYSRLSELKERLLYIFDQRERVGYGHIAIEDSVVRRIKRWG